MIPNMVRSVLYILAFILFYTSLQAQTIPIDNKIEVFRDSIQYYLQKEAPKDSSYLVAFSIGKYYYLLAEQYALNYTQLDTASGKISPLVYYDSAMQYLKLSTKKNKSFAPAYYYLGVMLSQSNDDYKNVSKYFYSAIKLDPDNFEYWLTSANYTSFFKQEAAISQYTKAIELNPSDYRAYMGRAAARSHPTQFAGDPQIRLIEEDFAKALSLGCDSAEVLLKRGWSRLHNARNYDDAILDYTVVIKLAPDRIEAYYFRAQSFYLNGQLTEACADYTRWKELGGTGWIYYIKEACGISYEDWYKK